MTSRRIALWAALAAATAWTAKSVAIGVAGGLDKSPLEGPLFFAGLLSFVVAILAVGVAAIGGRLWVRIAAGLGAFAAGLALTQVVDLLVDRFVSSSADAHWAWTELSLWVSCLAVLAIAVALNRSAGERHTVRAL